MRSHLENTVQAGIEIFRQGHNIRAKLQETKITGLNSKKYSDTDSCDQVWKDLAFWPWLGTHQGL